MVLLRCSSQENASNSDGNDDKAKAEEGRQACLLFSIDPKPQEQVQR